MMPDFPLNRPLSKLSPLSDGTESKAEEENL